MPVHVLKTELSKALGSSIAISVNTGLPRISAGVWLSLNERRYSEKYAREHLRALNQLYTHCDKKFSDPLYLDQIIMAGDLESILSCLRSFIAERQNHASISGTDQSRPLSMVTSIIQQVLSEIRYRNNSPNFDGARLARELSKLDGLYRFLKPAPETKNIKVRSLPQNVISHFLKILRPHCHQNPFRTEFIKHRNFLIFVLLYQMGLRRGELLLLSANCMNMGFDDSTHRDLYWLDIKDSNLYDIRKNTPRLKNNYSTRQIPLPEGLYALLVKYVANHRGRCSHGFLFSSQHDRPLSKRSLNKICLKLSKTLPIELLKDLNLRCGTNKVTPHNFRHSAAVDRIRSYRHSGIEMDHAESLLRAFFGWSPESKMPRLYARAFYEEQINTTWLNKFDRSLSGLLSYDK